MKKNAISDKYSELLQILKYRFDKNTIRHKEIAWSDVEQKLNTNPDKLKSLLLMEQTGGEPDVIGKTKTSEYIFCDCSAESPAGRRSLCYDKKALDSRKENKPAGSAVELADNMQVEILDEKLYNELFKLGIFDAKTSSWIKTPESVRKLGGALFAEYRYGKIFIFHNSAQSYYSSRGFRSIIYV